MRCGIFSISSCNARRTGCSLSVRMKRSFQFGYFTYPCYYWWQGAGRLDSGAPLIG